MHGVPLSGANDASNNLSKIKMDEDAISQTDRKAQFRWVFLFRILLLAAAFFAAWFLIWNLASLLLLAFGAVLVSVLISSLADLVERHTPLQARAAFVAATLAIGVFVAGLPRYSAPRSRCSSAN